MSGRGTGMVLRLTQLYDADLTTPTRWPSGSLKRPISTCSITSGPIIRDPPRLSAFASVAPGDYNVRSRPRRPSSNAPLGSAGTCCLRANPLATSL